LGGKSMGKNRGSFERLADLFRDSIQITVDEKTAMLYGYALSLPQKANQNEINLIILRIKSYMNSIVRVKNRMIALLNLKRI
jgi:hypothetical protein